jgi:TPR repeat protein
MGKKKDIQNRDSKQKKNYQLEAETLFYLKQPAKAISLLINGANLGNIYAQIYLAQCYIKGEGVAKNPEMAFKWFFNAAEHGDMSSQYNIGIFYEKGYGTKCCYSLAAKWYYKAAKQNYEKAKLYLDSFIQKMNEKAELEDASAISCLSYCYMVGIVVPHNSNKAYQLNIRAANGGDSYAQNMQGNRYMYGRKVKQDYNLAYDWYLKAAKQNNEKAQNNLGYFYESGIVVDQDYAKAIELYYRASEQFDADGKQNLQRVVCANFCQARKGNASSQYILGFCYEYGYGVKRNIINSIKWYARAVQSNNSDAQNNMSQLIHKLSNSNEQEDIICQYVIGMWHFKGIYLQKDYDKGLILLTKAAECGYTLAQYYLGTCYEIGLGENNNLEKALFWYKKAMSQGYPKAIDKITEIRYEQKKNISNSEENNDSSSLFLGPIQYNPISIESGIVKTKDIKDIND